MPTFCCGFNEFGQVSSEADNFQRGFVSLPAVVDLQSKNASVIHEGTGHSQWYGVTGSDYRRGRVYL